MKLNNFDSFNAYEYLKENLDEDINEGKLGKLAGITLIGLSSLLGGNIKGKAQSLPNDYEKYEVKTTSDPEEVNKLQITGWRLTDEQTDTIWEAAPNDTIVNVTQVKLAEESYFKSGAFELSEEQKDTIKEALDIILEDGGVLIKAGIEASTDKQGLSENLQRELKSQGFSPDNDGLSQARSFSVEKFLEFQGINDDLIDINNLAEQGESEIDQASRYVTISFAYLINEEVVKSDSTINIEKTYKLEKPVDETPRQKPAKKKKTKTLKKKINKWITLIKKSCGNKGLFSTKSKVNKCFFTK